MKIFLSSLIAGMADIREAARSAVTSLGHEAVMAETFGTRTQSPQTACLDGVRSADAVVLILGANYGAKQPSGVSATHEEYREARDRGVVLAFVEEGVERDPEQAAFVREVQAWDTGLFRAGFTGAEDLRGKVTLALHQWQLSRATAPLDAAEVLQRALAFFPEEERGYSSSGAALVVSVAAGPTQAILRPSQVEDEAFAELLLQSAMFGPNKIFTHHQGSKHRIENDALILEQDGRDMRLIMLDGQGSVVIRLPMEKNDHGMSAIIEEKVRKLLLASLNFANWLLDQIDPTNRLSHIVPAAQISGGSAFGWRTQREHDASPNSGSMRGFRPEGIVAVSGGENPRLNGGD
jgi:hypothetical protein